MLLRVKKSPAETCGAQEADRKPRSYEATQPEAGMMRIEKIRQMFKDDVQPQVSIGRKQTIAVTPSKSELVSPANNTVEASSKNAI